MSNVSPEKKHAPHVRKVKISQKHQPPKLTKVLPINPFANWVMPPEPRQYIKHREQDCL